MRAPRLVAAALAGHALASPASTSHPISDIQSPNSLGSRSLPTVDTLLREIFAFFPASVFISSTCEVISVAGNTAAELFGIPDTRSDPCGDVTLLFARGTCDLGNIGVLVAPFVASAIQRELGERSLAVQGLEYPAIVKDYLEGSEDNGLLMADLIKSTIAQCPSTKIVVGGYSQGAMVVHKAAAALDAATMARVSAVLLFGDPYSHTAVANIDPSRVQVYCNFGDNICDSGVMITPLHVTYALYADEAAAFVAARV